MKNFIKIIMLSTLSLAAISSLNTHCIPYETFQAMRSAFINLSLHSKNFVRYHTDTYRTYLNTSQGDQSSKILNLVMLRAKHLYGFELACPVTIQNGNDAYTDERIIFKNGIPAKSMHRKIVLGKDIVTTSSNDFLTYTLMHENKHCTENHGLKFASVMNTHEETALNIAQEEEADAAIKHIPELCHAAAQTHSDKIGQERKALCTFDLRNLLTLYDSNDPSSLKHIEIINELSHPLYKRRALYFKKWAEDGGLKTL